MLKKADEYGPPTPEIAYMMALTLIYTYWGELDKATMVFGQIQAHCYKSIALRPDAPEAYHLLAQAHYRRARILDRDSKRTDDAKPHPDFLESVRLYRRALALYDRQIAKLRGQPVLNERGLRTLMQQRMTTCHQLGDALRSLGMYAEAEQHYLDMEAIFPNNLRNVADLMKTYVMGRAWQEAQEYFYKSAFVSKTAGWDADVLIHAAWGIMGGSKSVPKNKQARLQIESYGYLDYALYMRPRYEKSWRQSNWDSAFGLIEATKEPSPSYERMLREEFNELPPHYFQPNAPKENLNWFKLVLGERWREMQLFKQPAPARDGSGFGPTPLFIGFLWQQLASLELSLEMRHKLRTYRVHEIGRLQAHFIGIIHKVIAEEDKIASTPIREGGLRLTFQYIDLAQELYEKLWQPFAEIIQDYRYSGSKYWITRTGRLVLDLYLRVAMLTARLLAQAGIYPLLGEMSERVVEQLEAFVNDWRSAYPFTTTQNDQKIGIDEHFTLIPFTFRYQRATFHAWRAYALLMKHDYFASHEPHGSRDDIQRDIASAKERVKTARNTLVPAHPLALFVDAKLHARDERYSEAIRELESLLDIIEPFDPKRDIGGSVSENTAPAPTSDADRGYLYHLERVAGRQQFHHIVNPVLVHNEIAHYAMKMGDERLAVTHLSEAVRFSPFSDTHLDIFITLAGLFSRMDRYADAQAVLSATMQPRSRLQGISLSPTKRMAPKVMQSIVITRQMFYARALRFTQAVAKEYPLVREDEIVEMVKHIYRKDETFTREFTNLTEQLTTSVNGLSPEAKIVTDGFIDKVSKITEIAEGDLRKAVRRGKNLGESLVAVLETVWKSELEPEKGSILTFDDHFPKVFKVFKPTRPPSKISEVFSHIALLAGCFYNRTLMRQLLESAGVEASSFQKAKFAEIADFYCKQASETLLQIADLCNALAYNRASTTIGDERFAKTDSLTALVIVCYLRSITDINHPIYDELGQRLAQYCDTYGWVQQMSVMPSSVQQRLIRQKSSDGADTLSSRWIAMLGNQPVLSQNREIQDETIRTMVDGVAKAIHCFEQGIHYDPTRSIIHYHLASAYLQTAETLLRSGDDHQALAVLVAANLDSAANELEVVRRTDLHGRLRERLKQQSVRYRQLKRQIGLPE
jgi:tetratricopeptide (TPR) repeat protein